MTPFKYNLTIYQGATFRLPLAWATGVAPATTPVDLTGCTARMQAREDHAAAVALLNLTTDVGGGIVLGGALGTVTVTMTAAQTAGITWESAVYDIEVVFPDSTVRRLVEGCICVSPEVTRAS